MQFWYVLTRPKPLGVPIRITSLIRVPSSTRSSARRSHHSCCSVAADLATPTSFEYGHAGVAYSRQSGATRTVSFPSRGLPPQHRHAQTARPRVHAQHGADRRQQQLDRLLGGAQGLLESRRERPPGLLSPSLHHSPP